MEYLDGLLLGEILEEEKNLPVGWTLDILEQVCSAVHEAHQQSIIHRDLKPDNIWLEPNRRGGYTVKVLDFGLAKLGDIEVGGAAEGMSSGASSSAGTRLPPGSATVPKQPPKTGGFEAGTYAQAADLSETATQMQRPPDDEASTLILAQRAEVSKPLAGEAATQLF